MERLGVEKRDLRGRKTDKLREEGWVPAVLYGPEIENRNLKVEEREFLEVFRRAGEASILELDLEGKKEHTVLVKDYDLDPVTDDLVHIDFYQPILDEKIEANAPLVFEGEAPAVKEKGGVLIKNVDEVAVSALPAELPSEIVVDVTELKDLEDRVKVKDLEVSSEVEVLRGEEEIVASVSAPKTTEELIEEMERKEEEELFMEEEVPLEEVEEEEEEEVAPEKVEKEEEQEEIEL